MCSLLVAYLFVTPGLSWSRLKADKVPADDSIEGPKLDVISCCDGEGAVVND